MSIELTRPVTTTWTVAFAETTDMAAGDIVAGVIYPEGLGAPGSDRFVISSKEHNYLLVCKSQGVVDDGADADIQLVVDGTPQPILTTIAECSAANTNGQGFKIDPVIHLPPSSNIQIRLILRGAPTGATTQYLYFTVQRVPAKAPGM